MDKVLPRDLIKPEARKALKDLHTTYGTYAILQAILQDSEEMLKTHHEEAVIQRDIVQLRVCVEDMKQNHFIRLLAKG